jgi:tryptophan halogenase
MTATEAKRGAMRIVIVGGGSAGWMAAAALGRIIGDLWSIELVESDAIATVGVGEATIPQIHHFNRVVGLDEAEFVARTKGSFKLGIEFVGWYGGDQARYMHAFGGIGRDLGLLPFHQYWLQARARGDGRRLEDYSQSAKAALANRFMREDALPSAPLGPTTYAYHFDAGLYAGFLREKAEANGVRRHEGRITQVHRDGLSGNVTRRGTGGRPDHRGRPLHRLLRLCLAAARQTMGVDYVDWSQWLPMNRALAVPMRKRRAVTPSHAPPHGAAGWQWRIPLQHRIGNGHVYCSDYLSDDEASAILLANPGRQATGDPRPLSSLPVTGREFWRAMSLRWAFQRLLEPLESTSLHLVQSASNILSTCCRREGIDPADVAAFNSQADL